jgi:phage tail sheath protein FI
MNPNTPGVQFQEVNESFFIQGAASDIGAMIGATERGPLSKPTLVQSWSDYKRSFGEFISTSFLPYCAKRALDQGASFYVVREDHKIDGVHQSVVADVTLPTAGGGPSPATLVGVVAGPYALVVGDLLGVKIDGGPAVNSAAVAATPATVQTAAGPFGLADQEWVDLRVGPPTDPVRRITFKTADFSNINAATAQELANVFSRDLPGAKVQIVSAAVKLSTDVKGTSARLEVVGASAPVVLTALNVSVAVNVGGGNVADLDHVKTSEIIALFVAPTGFTIADDGSGSLKVTGGGTGATHSIQIDGTGTSGTTASKVGLSTTVVAGGASTQVPTIKVAAANPGGWGNRLQVNIGVATQDPESKWRMDVLYKGTIVGSAEEMSMDSTSAQYFAKVLVTATAGQWVTATDLAAAIAAPANRPAPGTYSLAGGEEAVSTMVESDIIGDSDSRTGINALNPILDCSYVATPGWNTLSMLADADEYCQGRADMLYVGVCPPGILPAVAVDYRNAANSYAATGSKVDSSYSALYFSWLDITDPLTNLPKSIPCDGEVFAAFGRCQFPWLAPAGSQRGQVLGAAKLSYPLSADDLGLLYGVGVNSIWSPPSGALQVYGQKTLEVNPRDTDRINVRRLYIHLKRSIGPAVQDMVFEPNDDTLWRTIRRAVNRFMDEIKGNRGVFDFDFVNETSAEDIDANQAVFNLYLEPTKDAEQIIFRLISTPTGTVFQKSAA